LPDFSWYNIPKRVKYTKLQETISNGHTKFRKWTQNFANGHKISQMDTTYVDKHLTLQDPPTFTQIGIFGLKIYRLATLWKSGTN
jgi:hypothetical protein